MGHHGQQQRVSVLAWLLRRAATRHAPPRGHADGHGKRGAERTPRAACGASAAGSGRPGAADELSTYQGRKGAEALHERGHLCRGRVA